MDTFEGVKPKHGLKVIGVYKLVHRDSGKFYIGSTGDFYKRRTNHITELRSGRHPVLGLQELYKESPHFRFELLAIGVDHTNPDVREHAYNAEQGLLDQHWGDPLLLNRSRNARGLELPEEDEVVRIEKIRQTHQRPEVIEKVTKVNQTLRRSDEAREQQSAISKSLWQNDDHRARMETVWKDPDYLRRQVENQPTSKSVTAAGQCFGSISQAALGLKMSRNTIKQRIQDPAYPDYRHGNPEV